MADVTKIKLPDNSVVNIKDNRIPGIDEVPTENSSNIITSGGVYDAIVEVEEVTAAALNDLRDDVSTIDKVTAAALNDLKDRIDNIPEGGDEEDSDFEEVTAAALNDLNDRVLDLESSKELPSYSSSNNGQFLGVVNGSLEWVTPITIYTGTGSPDASTGNDGDIYIQTSE